MTGERWSQGAGVRFPMRLDAVWRPLLALFGGTEGRSYASVRDDAVRFRFGWFFDQVVPRAEIIDAQRARFHWWMGIGWRAWPGTAGLIGSGRGLVEVRLRNPRRLWVLALPWRYRRIVISLRDPDAFIAAIHRDAYAAASPVENDSTSA